MPIYDKDRVRFSNPKPYVQKVDRRKAEYGGGRHNTKKLTAVPHYVKFCGFCGKNTQVGTNGQMNLCMVCGH